MKQEFIIKIQGKQYEKGRGRIVFMLLCFIISLVILMSYSTRYCFALLAPIFYLLLRLKSLSAEKNYIADAVCSIHTHECGMEFSVQATQPKLCGTHTIMYNKINTFTLENQKVIIDFDEYQKNEDRRTVLEFYVMIDDCNLWIKLIEKVLHT